MTLALLAGTELTASIGGREKAVSTADAVQRQSDSAAGRGQASPIDGTDAPGEGGPAGPGTGRPDGVDDGDEIGAHEGTYVTTATDATLSTVGPELAVTRTYNSLDPRTGSAFGTGWSTRWDMRLRAEPATGTVLVTLADGARVRFTENADGTYSDPSDDGSLTLARESADWVLRERSGATYRFLPGGELTRITDAAGRGQTVTHRTPAGGPVRKVTDDLSGRALTFEWADGHVTSVTTSAVDAATPGLTWTYAYDGDQLTRVCAPPAPTRCIGYEYRDGSAYHSAVLDAGPSAYWRLGEREGAVEIGEAVSPTSPEVAFHRDTRPSADPAIEGTEDPATTFDGTRSVVELPAGTLESAATPTVELWFRTRTPSGVLVSFQNTELGERPTSWRAMLNIDGAGRLRGQFHLVDRPFRATPIVSAGAVTDGRWHHAVLTSGGGTQSLYLDGAKVGSLAGVLDEQARAHVYLGAGHGSSGWMSLARGEYHFKGQLDEVAFYDHALDAATVTEHYAARTAIGQLTRITLPSGRVHSTAAYDLVDGRLIRYTDGNGDTWKAPAPAPTAPTASPSSSEDTEDTGGRGDPAGHRPPEGRGGADAADFEPDSTATRGGPEGQAVATGEEAPGITVPTAVCRSTGPSRAEDAVFRVDASDFYARRDDERPRYRDRRSTDPDDDRWRPTPGDPYDPAGAPRRHTGTAGISTHTTTGTCDRRGPPLTTGGRAATPPERNRGRAA
ncbi:LamG-like jellyroll fold domain-containing protein [Streptomyces nodosus]